MLIRKPLPLWISVSLFVVAVTMIPLTGQVRRPASPPDTQTELVARLSQSTPPLHIVRLYPSRPEGPMWVCDRPQSVEDLRGMIRDPHRVQAGRWRGIVFCQRLAGKSVICDEFIRDNWGECGMRVGSIVYFGDPELLERIRAEVIEN